MTKSDFLKKYPELDDNGKISQVKLGLLKSYSVHYYAKKDQYVATMLDDFESVLITEKRSQKIDVILL